MDGRRAAPPARVAAQLTPGRAIEKNAADAILEMRMGVGVPSNFETLSAFRERFIQLTRDHEEVRVKGPHGGVVDVGTVARFDTYLRTRLMPRFSKVLQLVATKEKFERNGARLPTFKDPDDPKGDTLWKKLVAWERNETTLKEDPASNGTEPRKERARTPKSSFVLHCTMYPSCCFVRSSP